MRIDHPILVRFAMLCASAWGRAIHATMDIAFDIEDPQADPLRADRRNIYAFWHEMMLLPACTYGRFVTALISRHRDGNLIAHAMEMVRGRAIRGSTTRGGVASIRQMIREGRVRHLAITPDGPRGPRRVVQQGAVYLASRTGMPIIPLGLAYSACHRAKSWDRMAVPYPCVRARGVVGAPICVPAAAGREQLQRYRTIVQDAMDEAQTRAEDLADRGSDGRRLLSLAEMLDRDA